MSSSPRIKRRRLSSPSPPPKRRVKDEPRSPLLDDAAEQAEGCAICLQTIQDRTVLPDCNHDVFCFQCLLIWAEQSRKCPLCIRPIGEYIIHKHRSPFDYQKHFLPPLPSTSPSRPISAQQRQRIQSRRTRDWGRPRREREADELARAVERRRWVYKNGLYAKHVASNPYTRYRPAPSPTQFATSPDLVSRASAFLRRELLVWPNLDVEFLTTFVLSLMKSLDIRSEASVKLLAEFLDMADGGRKNAEHFAHEVYSYLRSPYRSLTIYDTIVQYDPPESPSVFYHKETHSKRRSPSPYRSGSPSRSPQGHRRYDDDGRYNDDRRDEDNRRYDSRAEATYKPPEPTHLEPPDEHAEPAVIPAHVPPAPEVKEAQRGPVKLVRNRAGPLASIRAHITSNPMPAAQTQTGGDEPLASSAVNGLRIKSAASSSLPAIAADAPHTPKQNGADRKAVDLRPPVIGLRIKNAARAAPLFSPASSSSVPDDKARPAASSEFLQPPSVPADPAPRRPSAAIMAEARARLAKELALAAAQPTTSNGTKRSLPAASPTTAMADSAANKEPPLNGEAGNHSLPAQAPDLAHVVVDAPELGSHTTKSQQALKDLLLAKLEKERTLLADSEQHSVSEKPTLERLPSDVRESRLRAQAKAQVRLAAEKRVLLEHS
ncbi:hypothetical protein CALCODRAFT_494801 [Calocera cornea HHB12733]|uniref:RING-type E3 ubiquitin transferase n=1 Tax=Calocera cornea HHB12733 TaxID=1353952 RepID=A0A165GV91_9BASI|nr:hypothetical protein CALCODRAFT_494801 [Calocera cornea HHB12733]